MELSARLTRIMSEYGLEERDVAYCDLVLAGWQKHEAAFYALNLKVASKESINSFLKAHHQRVRGIDRYIHDEEEKRELDSIKKDKAKTAELEKQARLRREIEASRKKPSESGNEGVLDKDDLIKLYSEIIRDTSADAKTKMDAAKGLSDLTQMKKEVAQVEDTRTHFYLPISCHKCGLYQNFQNELKKKKENESTKIEGGDDICPQSDSE